MADIVTDAGKQTVDRIRAAMQGRRSATLIAVTTLIDALAKRGDTVNFNELSSLVKCDSVLMARVLAQANTVGFKLGAARVATLPEAFHVLGIDRLRSVVLATLLVEHADSRNHAQREMALVSLASGFVAQTMAAQCGDDPEHGFLCGSLRNYGRLLLSTFQPAEFDHAREHGHACGNDHAAFVGAFGLAPHELAREILVDVKLPEPLFDAIANPGAAGAHEHSPNAFLKYAEGALAFTDVMFDPRLAADAFRTRAQGVLARFAPAAAATTPEQLDLFLNAQKAQFADYARYPEFSAVAERPLVSLACRVANKPLPRNSIIPGRASYPAEPGAVRDLTTLREDVLSRIAADLGARDLVLFTLDPFLGAFRLTRGIGRWSVGLHGSRLFAAGEKNLFSLSIALRQTLAIHDAREANVQPYVPGWLRDDLAPRAFFVMPLGGGGISQVLLVGWECVRKVVPPSVATILAYNHAAPTVAAGRS